MNTNAGQANTARGSIARMMTRALIVAALTLATFATTTAASEATQAPRCKVISQTQHLETLGTPGVKMATFIVTTTTSKCRGKIVVTRTSTRWMPGPR